MSSKKRRVGLFGGSFDPIHFGHLNLALGLLEAGKVDEVLFCPAYTSPLKAGEPPAASKEARLAMLALAIEPIKEFKLLDWEIKRAGPSYTIDTVRYLLEKEEGELHLILGDDALHTLSRWKEVEELLRLAPPLVGSRLGHRLEESQELSLELKKRLLPGLVSIPVLDISSTEIRKRLRQKKFCGYLMPAPVLDYISKNNLYV